MREMDKPPKRTMYILINNNLPTRTKNRFFSNGWLLARKEAILSGGCGKNILMLAMPRQ